ncbi:MAG: DUF881 domain-containing protein [Bacillota bacterium]|nr:DUF881 domain-containing protein [Bacillota bacterium]
MWESLFWILLGMMGGATITLLFFPESKNNPVRRHRLIQALSLLLLLGSGIFIIKSPLFLGQSLPLTEKTPGELALLLKGVNENNSALQEELKSLQQELQNSTMLLEKKKSLANSISEQIDLLMLINGSHAVSGPGLRISIQEPSNLMYYDIIDLVNELFLSGAEAVAINGQRFTYRMQIGERLSSQLLFSGESGRPIQDSKYVITINKKELEYPLHIQAIGPAATMEKAIDYPGGILESLSALYGVKPQLSQSSSITLPAAEPREFLYAQPLEK